MNSYNRRIADRLLHDELKMIHHVEQPEMLYNELDGLKELHDGVFYGGARPLKYVQAGETIATSEPRTLSVGRDPFENLPFHLVETGGNIRKRRGRKSKEEGGNIFDTIGSVAKTAAPFAPLLLMAAGLEKKKRGRPKKGGSFLSGLSKVAKSVAPVAQQIAVPVATNMAQQALTNYMSGSSGAGLKKRGRPKKGGKLDFLSTLKSVGKVAAPIAQQIGTKVVLPVATQALTNYAMSGAGMAKSKKTRKSKSGGSFLSSLKSVGKVVAPIASHVGKEVVLPVATDMAKQALTNYMTGSSSGAGLRKTTKRR